MNDHPSRRLVVSALVSLNGIASTPHTWVGDHFGPDEAAGSLAHLQRCDAMLMGRRTYDIFAQLWPEAAGDYAERINTMPKFVFSSTLTRADWTNTTVLSGDVVAAVTALKAAPGGDLVVYGHGTFGQTLCDAGLVDELTLTLVPVFVAEGMPLYRPGKAGEWELVDARPSGRGNVRATYRPAD